MRFDIKIMFTMIMVVLMALAPIVGTIDDGTTSISETASVSGWSVPQIDGSIGSDFENTRSPSTSNVEALDSYGDFEYDIIGDGTEVRILGYIGQGGNVTIPGTIESRPVTTIGEDAFKGCSNMTSVVMPDSIRTIGYESFALSSIVSVTFGEGTTTIGGKAFSGCENLESAMMPDSVTTVGWYAFYWCLALEEVHISENVSMVESYTFQLCTSLESIVIPAKVTSIGVRAFELCTKLSNITFEGDAPSLGVYWDKTTYDPLTVYYHNGSTGFTTPTWEGHPSICLSPPGAPVDLVAESGEGYVNLSWSEPFDGNSTLTDYTVQRDGEHLSNSTTTWYNDTTVLDGHSYTYVVGAVNDVGEGNGSMVYVGDLEYRLINNDTEVEITGYTGPGGNVTVPSEIEGLPVTTIGDCAFRECISLISVTIGDSVTTIGWGAFEYCSSLTSFKVPMNVASVRERAFRGCSMMTSINFDGDAPIVGVNWIADHNDSLIMYYYAGSAGFTTPTWQGLPSVCLSVPDAPSELVNADGKGYVNLTWTEPSDGNLTISHYSVYRNGALSNNVMTSWYNDTTVVAGCEYTYNVTAVNELGEGPHSANVGAHTVPAAPGSVDSVSGPGHVNITWAAPADGGSPIDHYDVYRDGTLLSDTSATWYDDTSVVAGNAYTYDVRAVNEVGEGPLSASVDGNTVPAAPSPTTDCGKGYVNITWAAPADGGSPIDHYDVYRDGTLLSDTSATWYDDTSVVAGNAYTYIVTAMNDVGGSVPSANVTGCTVPVAPSGLQVIVGPGWHNVSWLMPTDGGSPVTHFNVSTETSVEVMALEVLHHVGDRWYHNITDVRPGTQCNYTVSAMNDVGWSDVSDSVFGMSVPTVPCDLTPDAVDASVDLAWDAPADGGSDITSYNIYRNGTLIGSCANTSYVDDTVDAYTWYAYSVTAVNAVGEGPASTVDVFVPDETAPTVNITSPSDGAVIASFDVMVIWTANDSVSGLASFNVTVDGDEWFDLNASTFSRVLILEEGTHVVTVTACDVAGNHANATVGFTIAIRPVVVDHSPTGDDASKSAAIVIEFSEPMDHDSVVVTCGDVTLTSSWDDNVVALTHDVFDANTTHTVVVNGEDTHGNAMDEYTWSFTTENVVTVTGVVSNGDGPVVNATVTLDSGETTMTDSEGHYSLTTTPGERTITVTKDSFDTVTETVTVTTSAVQTFDETLNPTTSSSMLWLGVIVALVVVAAIALVVYRRL